MKIPSTICRAGNFFPRYIILLYFKVNYYINFILIYWDLYNCIYLTVVNLYLIIYIFIIFIGYYDIIIYLLFIIESRL